MIHKIFVLISLFSLINSIDGACATGWYQLTSNNKKCIKWLEPQTWNQGQTNCKAANSQATLLVISNAFENKEIYQWLQDTNNPYDNYIGLNCIAHPYNWVWNNGDQVTYTNWYIPPSNQTGSYCGYMLNYMGGWVDGPCDMGNQNGILCQYLLS